MAKNVKWIKYNFYHFVKVPYKLNILRFIVEKDTQYETLSVGSPTFLHANNRGVDQLAHMCSLVCASFVCLVISIQAVHVTGKIII